MKSGNSMYFVIFEVFLKEGCEKDYLAFATSLRKYLDQFDGFIEIDRFRSISDSEKMLSLSSWKSLEAIEKWKKNSDHHQAQLAGRSRIFKYYKISVCQTLKSYDMNSSNLGKK